MVEVFDRPVGGSPPGGHSLSEHDVQALRHLAAGKSVAEIAVAMSVSRNTVRTRLRRIQDKLSASGRDDAVRRAREHGIL